MKNSINRKVMLGLSGGVDSAVSASLLLEQGFEVIGLTLIFSCRSEEVCDRMINDAKAIASHLKIEHIVHDARAEFEDKVISPFVDAWRHGDTPNPCVLCNPVMKFPSIVSLADKHDCDFIATGHYARTADAEGRLIPLNERERGQEVTLLRASDKKKDQSYFLYALPQQILSRVLFPLGEMTKAEVRALAAERGIPLAQKADSQEICFLPDDERIEFLREQGALGDPGPYLDTAGKVIGEHAGIGRYTIGQRKKLGQSFGKRMTVLRIIAEENAIVLGDESECRSTSLLLGSYVSTGVLDRLFASDDRLPVLVQLRSQGQAIPGTIELNNGTEQIVVRFPDEVRLTAPGQSAVFYRKDMVLGGGVVVESSLDQ